MNERRQVEGKGGGGCRKKNENAGKVARPREVYGKRLLRRGGVNKRRKRWAGGGR